MAEKYFQKVPDIIYNNLLTKDLTRRVTLDQAVKKDINMFYPVQLKEGLRADSLAAAYYDDSELDWALYLTNDVVDPYYGWYLSTKDFEENIINKYGSIAASQEKIKFYRNNWYETSQEISPNFYDNTLAEEYKKYYEPVFGAKNSIISYRRKQEDWVQNTNKILQYTIALSNSEVEFVSEEIVDIKTGGEIVGGGEIVFANTSTLIIQHVSGNTSANTTATKTIIGETSGANGTANAVLTSQENITNAEAVYWSSVSYYDWENEENEKLKSIDVIDEQIMFDVSEEIRLKFKE